MTRLEFLDVLRRRLAGLPPEEIDELVGDYAAHFADGLAAGRSEALIAEALGDPVRLARELRAEAGLRRWETARTPSNFFSALFGFLALIAVDFIFLLPLLGALALFALVTALVMIALCIAGIALALRLFHFDHGLSLHYLTRVFAGVGLLGLGVGGGALLVMGVDYALRLLGSYVRLHYELLNETATSS
ncbi:MAG: DUF1700 domain-containing protein [Alphaproteobacteria bacterium]|nr:DUF1700 domain-containing protein [Alphaproteobacteria bacterium]